jgi:hypothetical protein
LFRRVDEEQTAERPERLAAEILLAFLIDHDNALAGIGNFRSRDKARESAADDDDIRINGHTVSPILLMEIEVGAGTLVNGNCARRAALFQIDTATERGASRAQHSI